jgi:hypothetical protein
MPIGSPTNTTWGWEGSAEADPDGLAVIKGVGAMPPTNNEVRYTGNYMLTAAGSIREWGGTQQPTRAQCVELLVPEPASAESPRPGTTYCLRLENGRMGRLVVDDVATDQVTIRLKIWL